VAYQCRYTGKGRHWHATLQGSKPFFTFKLVQISR
jgi:hypothetical protein